MGTWKPVWSKLGHCILALGLAVATGFLSGISGVLTFQVNQDGVVYQKDLGPMTVEVGRAMTRFDPDSSRSKGQAN